MAGFVSGINCQSLFVRVFFGVYQEACQLAKKQKKQNSSSENQFSNAVNTVIVTSENLQLSHPKAEESGYQ